MRDMRKTAYVHCDSKNRDVEVEFIETGSWYNRRRVLLSCPALTDAGDTCDRACLKPETTPSGYQDMARRSSFHL